MPRRRHGANWDTRQPQEESGAGEDASELVAACRRGDRDAQRRLYERHRRRVYALMVRMVGRQDAADLTQQVFLRVLQSLDQFAGRSRLETWLHRVAVNEALQHLRRKGRTQAVPLAYEPPDPAPPAAHRTEHADLLEQALARLDPELRALFLLREVEQLSYREIAEALDLNEGTIGSRLNRARDTLRKILTELGWRP